MSRKNVVRLVFVMALLGLVSSALAQGLVPVEQDRRVQNFATLTNAKLAGIKAAILELQGLLSKVDSEATQELQQIVAKIKDERVKAAKAAEAKASKKANVEAEAKGTAKVDEPQPIPVENK